jgi:hypothetical protein
LRRVSSHWKTCNFEAIICQKSGELAAGTTYLINPSVIGWRAPPGPDWAARGAWITAMPPHLERIDWMPSPPLAPDDGPIDMAHLGRITLGDIGLEREVLAMFAGQSAGLCSALATLPPEAATLVHTLKGSARAVGAVHVAEAAEGVEAALRGGAELQQALAVLCDSIAEVQSAIDVFLNRS